MVIRSTQDLCLPLHDANNSAQAGGKAANLERAAGLGFSIPESFVITTSALDYFLKQTALHARVTTFLAELTTPIGDLHKRDYENLCHEIMAASVPDRLRFEFASHAEPLLARAPHGLVVRSSARCEDSGDASFAGIFESFLCIRTEEELWRSIKQCWCSCWNPQAAAYADRMGLSMEPDGMGVLLQETLHPDSSGVIFTADPVTGSPWQFTVNATFGFLEAAIDGEAAMDSYRLGWDTADILDQDIAAKTTRLTPGDSRLLAEPNDPVKAHQPSLDDKNLHMLWSAAAEIDRAFARPMDIEWVMQSDRLVIVQVRPITSLPQFFPHDLAEEDAQLTWYLSSPYWYEPAEVGGRLVAPLFRHIWDADMWLRAVPEGMDLLSRNCREMDFNGYRYTTDGWSGVSPDYLDLLAAQGEEEQITQIFKSLEGRLDEIDVDLRGIWAEGKERILDSTGAFREEIDSTVTVRELIPFLLQMLEVDPRGNFMGYGAPQSLGLLCERMLKRFLHEWLPEFPVASLVLGLPSFSHARVAAAQGIGRRIKEKPVRNALETMPLEELMPYLIDHGNGKTFMQEIEELCWTFGQCPPSWRDRPSIWTTGTASAADFATEILVTIKKAMQGSSRDVGQLQTANGKIAQQAADQVRQQLSPSLHGRFDKLLDWTRFWYPILDDRLWPGGREQLMRYELLWRIATGLIRQGILDRPEEVLLLSREDLASYQTDSTFDLQRAFLASRAQYAKNGRLSPPPYLGKSPSSSADPVDLTPSVVASANSAENTSANGHKQLAGTGRSPGKTQGRARVASGLSTAFVDDLSNEDILVCLQEIPYRVDWLAIFLVTKGLVAASTCGAGLHHAMQIARECGVVYVELTAELVAQIADDTLIELDGAQGLVTILKE